MSYQITNSALAALGGQDALQAAIVDFSSALAEHAQSVGQPAPVASALVDEIVKQHGGQFEVEPAAPAPTLAEAIAAKLSEIAVKRLAVETGGIMFGAVPIPTDRQTAAIITSAYIKATANPAFVVENWKVTDAVFVTLDAPTIIALGDAVSAHVQASFNRNAALSQAVLGLETVEAVNAFDVDAEWDADPEP